MTNATSKMIVRLEKKFGIENMLSQSGYNSLFDIVRVPRARFISHHRDVLTNSVASGLYDHAMGYAQQIGFAYRQHRQTAAAIPDFAFSAIGGPTYVGQFSPDWAAMSPVNSIEANTSPAAYLTSLYNLAMQEEKNTDGTGTVNFLAKRRPDIPAMIVNEDAVNQVVPMLEIVNGVLTSAIQAQLPTGQSTDQALATTYYPNTLPYHFAYEQAAGGLAVSATTLADVKLQVDPAWPYFSMGPALLSSGNISEQQVNTTTDHNQTNARIASLADGGWVVVWHCLDGDKDSKGVFFQQYNRFGGKIAGEMRVGVYIQENQGVPVITALMDGGWVVAWSQDSSDNGVYHQRYDDTGARVGAETKVNISAAGYTATPSIAGLKDGGWVVSWQSRLEVGGNWCVYQQRFNGFGARVDTEAQVNVFEGDIEATPSIMGLNDGGWILAWQGWLEDSTAEGVYQQRFSSSGHQIDGETHVNYHLPGKASSPTVANLNDGGWVLAWQSFSRDGSGEGIYQQRFNKSGATVGAETQVNSYTKGDQTSPSIAGLKDGGWVVAWTSPDQDGSGTGIYQQCYDISGARVGVETQVNNYTKGDQTRPSIAGLKDGGWVVAWTSPDQDGSGTGIFQQLFSADGTSIEYNDEYKYAAFSSRNAAIRLASSISPALLDTVEHVPYFSTVMHFVTGVGEDRWPSGQTFPSANAVSIYSTTELSPWYNLGSSAYVTPKQTGIIEGPIATAALNSGVTTLKILNETNQQGLTLASANCVFSRNTSGTIQAESYILNGVSNSSESKSVSVPLFQFQSNFTSGVMVSFFVRMYDTINSRYWTDISYTFASKDYQKGNIYTPEQKKFFTTYFGVPDNKGVQNYPGDFSQVDYLCGRTGLSVAELEGLLSTQVGDDKVIVSPNIVVRNLAFVNNGSLPPTSDQTTHEPYHYGAVYLHGGKKPAMSLTADSHGALTLNDLTEDRIDRLNRLVRLRRLFNVPYDQLDYLITSGMHAEGLAADKSDGNLGLYMNANTTRLLGVFNYYHHRYGATAEQFAAITDQITPYAIAPKVPLLDRVFNRKRLFDEPYVVNWQDVDPTATTATNWGAARIMKQIASGLNITDAEMIFLASELGSVFANSLANISSFYRITTLARWLDLDVITFMRLVDFLDRELDGFALKPHLIGAPMISIMRDNKTDKSDWLDSLALLSIVADWLAQTGLSVAEVAQPFSADSTRGTQGQLDFIHQLSQATKSTLVTEAIVLHSGAPVVDTSGNTIDWVQLLTKGTEAPGTYGLLDTKGLVLDEAFTLDQEVITTSVGKIVDNQGLSLEDKAAAKATLSSLIWSAKQAQDGMLATTLAQQLATDQNLILPFCCWADITPHQFLGQILDQQDLSDVQKIDIDTIADLNRFAQCAQMSGRYELSPAMLDLYTQHKTWFAGDAEPVASLRAHFAFASYQQWLHRTPQTEDDLLSYLTIVNASPVPELNERATLLAKTLGWDAGSVSKALTYITGSQNDPKTSMLQIAAVMRLQDQCAQTGLNIDDLTSLEALQLESDYAAWQQLGQAAVVGAGQISIQ